MKNKNCKGKKITAEKMRRKKKMMKRKTDIMKNLTINLIQDKQKII